MLSFNLFPLSLIFISTTVFAVPKIALFFALLLNICEEVNMKIHEKMKIQSA